MVYAGVRMYRTIGPSRAAISAEGDLWLLSHGKLHRFGSDGLRRQVVDLEAIGAPARPSDFDLHRDGRAVIADPDTSELVRCTLPAGPCQRLPARLKTLAAQPILPLNAAKVHVDDAGGRYFVSDNASHRVVVLDFEGTVKAQSKPGLLRHPNRIALTAPDRLAIVDTDHLRIVTVDAQLTRVVDDMSTEAGQVARPGRHWPFDAVSLPNGDTAVLIAAHGMRNADLVFFDARGAPLRRAALGKDADPFDVEIWRGRLWVADATRYRFDAVDFEGKPAAGLEDAEFARELQQEADKPRIWRFVRIAAQAGLVALPLAGALVLWKLTPRPVGPATPSPASPGAPMRPALLDAPAAHTVRARSRLVRNVRWVARAIAWLQLALILGLVTLLVVRYPVVLAEGGRFAAMLAGYVLMAIVLFVVYRRIPRMYEQIALVLEARGLRYEVPTMWLGPRPESGFVPWDAVFISRRRVLAGSRLFEIETRWMTPVLDEGDEAALRRAIPAANHVGALDLTRKAWRAGALRRPLLTFAIGMAVGVAAIRLVQRLL